MESVILPSEKVRVKLGTVLIETVLSEDSLYNVLTILKTLLLTLGGRGTRYNIIASLD